MDEDARERAREAQRRYRERNRETLRERDRQRKEANREAINQRARERRAADPEADREKHRRYREKDPERSRERTRRYRAANPEKVREATRQNVARWREANPEKVRETEQRHRGKLKAAVLDHYGHGCACCGTTERLTVDHVNGDGHLHRAEVGVGWAIYRWLVNNGFPDGFQILCLPCNVSKKRGTHCRLNHPVRTVERVISDMEGTSK
jgi:hypothetical protein